VRVIDSNNVNLPAIGLNGFNPGALNLTLFNSSLTRLLNLELTALESDGQGKVISSRASSRPTRSSDDRAGHGNPLSAGHLLGCHVGRVPQGRAEARGDAADHAGRSDLHGCQGQQGHARTADDGGPAIDTKNVQTQVLVENGGTVVLGVSTSRTRGRR